MSSTRPRPHRLNEGSRIRARALVTNSFKESPMTGKLYWPSGSHDDRAGWTANVMRSFLGGLVVVLAGCAATPSSGKLTSANYSSIGKCPPLSMETPVDDLAEYSASGHAELLSRSHPLTLSSIQQTFDGHRKDLQQAYEQATWRNESLPREADLTLVVSLYADGSVGEVKVVRSAYAQNYVDEELQRRIEARVAGTVARLRFPSPGNDICYVFSYRLHFEPT